MTKKNLSKWNADAEAMMMGFTVEVESPEHVKYLTGYVLEVLTGDKRDPEEIFNMVHKYNSEGTPVSHMTTSSSGFGRLLTYVRDEEMEDLTSRNGVLAYVYNIDYVDCSELGYTFFENSNGKVRRIG